MLENGGAAGAAFLPRTRIIWNLHGSHTIRSLRGKPFRLPALCSFGAAFAVLLSFSARILASPQYGQTDVEDLEAKHYYAHVKSIVDYSPDELKHKYAFLKHLQPAQNQEALPDILQKLGQNVELLFEHFPNTTCKEIVNSARLKNDGSVDEGLSQEFNYVILARPGEDREEFEEYRTDSKGHVISPTAMQGASLLTTGFVSMPIHFLPRYQPQSRFLYLGRDNVKKVNAQVIAFAQIFGKAQEIGAMSAGGQTALLLTQGEAWLDPKTFQILRMKTDLLAPRPDVGIEQQTTDINFGPVAFKNPAVTLWLPRQVSVVVTWNNFTFRNTHSYSHFRLFTVETKVVN